MRKRYTIGAIAVGLAGLVAPAAQAAPNEKANQPLCFTDDSGSECIRQGSKFTIVNDGPGEYGGVYVEEQSLAGSAFSDIKQLGFTYSGDVSGGSPRLSIPILGGDGRDGWVFIDAASCNDGAGAVAPLTDPTCVVSGYYHNADNTTDGFYYESWDAFVAGEEGSTVGDWYTFIVADQPGTVTIGSVKLGRTPPGKLQ